VPDIIAKRVLETVMGWGWIVAIVLAVLLLALGAYIGAFFWSATFRG
jgi:hypothetical protein